MRTGVQANRGRAEHERPVFANPLHVVKRELLTTLKKKGIVPVRRAEKKSHFPLHLKLPIPGH